MSNTSAALAKQIESIQKLVGSEPAESPELALNRLTNKVRNLEQENEEFKKKSEESMRLSDQLRESQNTIAQFAAQ